LSGLAAATGEALAVDGLRVARGGREVLGGVDLRLGRGEVVALLGPNGAGKSTLLEALAGLLPRVVGTVSVAGRLAAATQTAALAGRSVLGNVELALSWWGTPRPERRRRALSALDALGLSEFADRPARELSGGEARRVHLARVLAVQPDVLLLDEPFAGLDPAARGDLLYQVAGVLRDPARGTLIVVHDRSEAWALADRVGVLVGGRLVAIGPPAAILDNPPSAEVARFLGFAGEIREGGWTHLARQGQVILDQAGPLRGRVARKLPTEDGIRLELELANGRLIAHSPLPGPELEAVVGVRIDGGVRFRERAEAAGGEAAER
jgi:ABC-type nitrate/sulfonate/bicarbonate transport system ATPase subunit